ncbi:hypothetical protein FGO68_gene11568 [Halteria grandinella]|uniref:Uncharacterized protein n=1 Tax=Halteria grandinella TaxID=5974 RepID=A0A8J8T2Y5_HALGN|nr:hypothetical protein FGO68_gene11568 [Halteria grandinella]
MMGGGPQQQESTQYQQYAHHYSQNVQLYYAPPPQTYESYQIYDHQSAQFSKSTAQTSECGSKGNAQYSKNQIQQQVLKNNIKCCSFNTPPSTSKMRERRISLLEESPVVEHLHHLNETSSSGGERRSGNSYHKDLSGYEEEEISQDDNNDVSMQDVVVQLKKKPKRKDCCNNKYQSKTRMCQRYDEDKENYCYNKEAMMLSTIQKQQLCQDRAKSNCLQFGCFNEDNGHTGYEETPCGKNGNPSNYGKLSTLEPFTLLEGTTSTSLFTCPNNDNIYHDESRRQLFSQFYHSSSDQKISNSQNQSISPPSDNSDGRSDENECQISSFIDLIILDGVHIADTQEQFTHQVNGESIPLFENSSDYPQIEAERQIVSNSSIELLRCFITRYNQRDSTILQLFAQMASFEFLNIGQSMSTEEALLLMDQEVQGIDALEESLLIDYTPPTHNQQISGSQGNGFSLFFITFEGNLYMKQHLSAAQEQVSSQGKPNSRQYKVSFMIEGRLVREEDQSSAKFGEIKETIVTVKATKMDIQA